MNNVVLIGRLTKDPELRYIPESQNAVAAFSIAVDRPFGKDKQADFVKITVFGKQAENCERFLAKGRMAAIQGRLQTGSYQNKDGNTVYTTDVVADRVEFLEWGEKASGDSGFKFKEEDENQTPESMGFMALTDDDSIPF